MRKLLEKLGVRDKASAWQLFWQFFKFGLVGLSNTVISLVVYYLLLYLGVQYLLAHCVGFAVSVVNAFFWNSRYVFSAADTRKGQAFAKTVIAYGGTFVLGLLFMWLLVEVLGISDIIAPVINLCLTIPLNFLLNKLWTFRK